MTTLPRHSRVRAGDDARVQLQPRGRRISRPSDGAATDPAMWLDPRDMGDRELFAFLLLGDLPRPGWQGRNQAIAWRALQVAGLTVAVVLVGLAVCAGIVVVWAATL